MAVIYSKLGGCFGQTTKLGYLARTDICALVKGLLDRLMTHFGLGSSLGEEPWGLFCLLGKGEALASWELVLLVTWEPLALEEPDWEALLSGWEIALSTRGVLPAWELPAWEWLFWEVCKALSLPEHPSARAAWGLPAWETSLSAWEKALSARDAGVLPAWETVFSAWERLLSAGRPGGCLPGRLHSLPEKEHCLMGKPACLLPEEKP